MKRDIRDIAYVVLYVFIKVIVKNGLFAKFICSTNGSVVALRFPKLRDMWENRRGLFSQCKTPDDIINEISKIIGPVMGENEVEYVQLASMTITNILLHECIEVWGVDIGKLSMLGQEIFDTSCQHLLGKGYIDITDEIIKKIDKHKF